MSICINHCNFKFYLGLKFKYNWYNLNVKSKNLISDSKNNFLSFLTCAISVICVKNYSPTPNLKLMRKHKRILKINQCLNPNSGTLSSSPPTQNLLLKSYNRIHNRNNRYFQFLIETYWCKN